MGFTPVEEDGLITKVLVRKLILFAEARSHVSHVDHSSCFVTHLASHYTGSQASQDARTVQMDSTSTSFFWANYLWDTLAV